MVYFYNTKIAGQERYNQGAIVWNKRIESKKEFIYVKKRIAEIIFLAFNPL